MAAVTEGDKIARRAGFGLVDAKDRAALYLIDGYWIYVGADVDPGALASFALREAQKRAGESDERQIRKQVEARGLAYLAPPTRLVG